MHKVALVLALLLGACTSTPTAIDPPPPSSSVPTPTPTIEPDTATTGRPTFSVDRAMRWIDVLAGPGPREATSDAYVAAGKVVRRRLKALGYDATFERFSVPAGTVDQIAVDAGRSFNVVATPLGFDPRKPHIVVGGHLDTVPDAPGANDNASGIAVILELARLATVTEPRLPLVFVAFGAEERRGSGGLYAFGSRAYVDSLDRRERQAIRGYFNLDMVGAGERVIVVGSGALFNHTLQRARRLDIPAGPGSARSLLSDHLAFEGVGIEVAWLWAGEHPTLHEPTDVPSVVQRAEIRRVGKLAWDSLRRFRR